MPHNFDFSKIENIKTLDVKVDGWIYPLYIEYGIYDGIETGGVPSYYWRVKGTFHTFVIPVLRMDFLSSGNYRQHFENALKIFKEDYLQWRNEGFITEWAREYNQQFSRFIIV